MFGARNAASFRIDMRYLRAYLRELCVPSRSFPMHVLRYSEQPLTGRRQCVRPAGTPCPGRPSACVAWLFSLLLALNGGPVSLTAELLALMLNVFLKSSRVPFLNPLLSFIFLLKREQRLHLGRQSVKVDAGIFQKHAVHDALHRRRQRVEMRREGFRVFE